MIYDVISAHIRAPYRRSLLRQQRQWQSLNHGFKGLHGFHGFVWQLIVSVLRETTPTLKGEIIPYPYFMIVHDYQSFLLRVGVVRSM